MIHTIKPLYKASRLNVELPASFCKVRGVVVNMFSLFFGSFLVLLDFLILETQGYKALFIWPSRVFPRFIVISDYVQKYRKSF